MAKRSNTKPERIEHKHIILCEGEDDKWFLIRFLESEQLKYQPAFSTDFQIFTMDGVDNVSEALQLLKNTDGYSMVESILIIRDADTNANSASDVVKTAFQKADLPVPVAPHVWKNGRIKTGFLLFPSCDGTPVTGALEDLCMQILEEENVSPVMGQIDSLINELRTSQNRIITHVNKSRLHTYFSVTEKYISSKIGEAAKAGAFNWASDKIKPLIDFLEELFPADQAEGGNSNA